MISYVTRSCRFILVPIVMIFFANASAFSSPPVTQIIQTTGVDSGLVLVVAEGEQLAVDLAVGGRFLVHMLVPDKQRIAGLRERIDRLFYLGLSIGRRQARRLTYGFWIWIVCSEGAAVFTMGSTPLPNW